MIPGNVCLPTDSCKINSKFSKFDSLRLANPFLQLWKAQFVRLIFVEVKLGGLTISLN